MHNMTDKSRELRDWQAAERKQRRESRNAWLARCAEDDRKRKPRKGLLSRIFGL